MDPYSDHFGSKLASQATNQTTSQVTNQTTNQAINQVNETKSDRISDERLVDKNQTLINTAHVLSPATSPALNVISLNANPLNSLCNLSTPSSGSSFATIVPANQPASSKMTNGLIDTDRPACRSSSSSSSNASDLSANTKADPKHEQTSQSLCSSANPLSSFPFFNTFNLLHPILNKHLYSGNGLNFSPFAYLNQLQNVRQLASPAGLLNGGQSSFATNLVTNQLTNSNIPNCTNSSTATTSSAPTNLANNSTLVNPQHALRCKDEISSLASGTVFCSL